jgi:uncharacterized protein (TIRG00374 family)
MNFQYKNRFKRSASLLKLLLSLALLIFLVQKVKMNAILTALGNAQLKYYLLSMSIYMLSQPLRTLRWGILLRTKGIHLSQGRLLRIYFIGMFFNTFLPTIMGGDAVRSYYIYKETKSPEISLASVIIERFCGLFTLIGIGFFASFYFRFKFDSSPVVTVCLYSSLTLLFIMAGFLLPPIFRAISWPLKIFDRWNIYKRIHEVYQAVLSYKQNPLTIVGSFLLSLCFVFTIIIICYFLSLSLSWGISFYPFLFMVPLITVISMIPISFGGVGIREGAFVMLFAQIGVPAASAFSLSLLWYSINLLAGLIGGLLYPSYHAIPASDDKRIP